MGASSRSRTISVSSRPEETAMTEVKKNSTRRAFFLNGGAVLGAGVAATAGATALSSPAAAIQSRGSAEDREAIRQLHLAFAGRVESQRFEDAADLFAEQASLQLSG